MLAPGLPPGIEGPSQGNLHLSIDQVVWNTYKYDVIFRIKFWGEETSGILLQSSSSFLTYEIKTTLSVLIKYLADMKNLIIEALAQDGFLVGQIKVNLKNIKQANHNINFHGNFPIVFKKEGKVGFATIVIRSKMNRPDAEILSSFQANEIKVQHENDLNNKNSDLANKNKTKKIFLKKTLNKIPKPSIPQKNTQTLPIPQEPSSDTLHMKNTTNATPTKKVFPIEPKLETAPETFPVLKLKIKILYVKLKLRDDYKLLCLDCSLYQSMRPDQISDLPDSYHITSIQKDASLYYFNYESQQNCGLCYTNSSIFNYKIHFAVRSAPNELAQLLGTAEIAWKEILSFEYKATVTLTTSLNGVDTGELVLQTIPIQTYEKFESRIILK